MTDQSYAPPKSDLSAAAAGGFQDILAPLLACKPWVRFLSIMGFIFTALITLAGVFMMFGGMAMQSAMGAGMGAGFSGAIGGAVGFVYLLMALLYFFPSYMLHKYANGITRAAGTQSQSDIAFALTQQKSFFKFLGIVALIMLLLMLVPFVIGIVAGIAAI